MDTLRLVRYRNLSDFPYLGELTQPLLFPLALHLPFDPKSTGEEFDIPDLPFVFFTEKELLDMLKEIDFEYEVIELDLQPQRVTALLTTPAGDQEVTLRAYYNGWDSMVKEIRSLQK